MDKHLSNKQSVPPVFAGFLKLLSKNWRWGQLTLALPDGQTKHLVGSRSGHRAVLVVHDYRFASRVLRSGDIGFADGYMAGEWDTPDLPALLETLANNYDHIRRLFDGSAWMKAVNWLGHSLKRNSRSGAKRNIHAHYDLGNDFYRSWLDPSMTYSSARFEREGMSLEEAQRAKYAALARMIDLKAGQTVLEIGCGWGGFAEFAAREVGASVTGITISKEQYDFTRRRMSEAGLNDKVDIRFVDYRDIEGQFDRVVSIEMFEAVGREYWPAYFQKISDVLKPQGAAGLQVITIQDELFEGYAARTDFIQKYIFPGGTLPSEAQLKPVITEAGLEGAGLQRFGHDYADTLSLWAQRFEASWSDIARANRQFDTRFRRLWRFYLAYCEAGFRSERTDVIQMRLNKPA